MEVTVAEAIKMGVSHHSAGQLDQAEELYRLILQSEPNHPDALAMLGTLLSQRGRHDDGLDLIERAISINPAAPDFHANHGLILFSAGRVDDALNAYHKALQLRPDTPNVFYNIGNALQRRNQVSEAIEYYHRAIALKPDDAHAWCNLGSALLRQNRVTEAIVAFHSAIESREDYAEAMSNLGTALSRDKKLDEATQWYARAAALRPNVPEIVNNYSGALKDSGRLEEALAAYRRALAVSPNPIVHSNLIFMLQYHPDFDGRSIAIELDRWKQSYAMPLEKEIQIHLNHSVTDRRLKIGYISSNFFEQAEAYFVLPLLAAHDRERFEIHCFSTVRKPDQFTDHHRQFTDVWHDVLHQDDADLAKTIREASIDILVDLSMHMGENRLLLFARKPAPVQVTWLAYPGSTGLTTIDYRITDATLDPPASNDSIYSEKSVRLPGSWVCYDPMADCAPRPADQNGPITFGSLNNPCKINPRNLRIWAQLMRQLPDSRLLILSESEQQQLQIRRIFDEATVGFDRLSFVTHTSRADYLRQYDRIDICLDPLPYNGITTTCDALWMGVPVVTQIGRTAAGRAGASALRAAGFGEWVAQSSEQFIQIALELARDIPSLTKLRSTLRDRVCQSDLMNAPKFAGAMESAYREMWSTWCAQWER